MRAGIELRKDYSPEDLRRLARRSDDVDQTRRLFAIAVILDGGSRTDAARTGGVGLQVIRDWVLRFDEGGPDALRTRKAPGKKPTLTDDQRRRLAAAVEAGPKSAFEKGDSLGGFSVIHGVSTAIKPGPTPCLLAMPIRPI